MKTYLIAHDLGTTGDKATLFSEDGELIRSVTKSYPTDFFSGNSAEQDPDDWWAAFCRANHELLEGMDPFCIAAVSFSGQMMGCVAVDRGGVPLRKAIIWADTRSSAQEKLLRERFDPVEFYHITGHRPSASYSLAKLLWIRDNEKGVYSRLYKVLQPKDYIIYKLTGCFVTDFSDASGTNAFDIRSFCWSERILGQLAIPSELFPEAYPSTKAAGKILKSVAAESGLAAGTLVVIGGGDGVCAAVGSGAVEEGDVYNYLGSSSWISVTSEQPVFDDSMRTFNWAHMLPGKFSPTGTMQAAGNSYSFVKNLLYDGRLPDESAQKNDIYGQMDVEMKKSVVGANGLLFLPYLLGERSPRWNPRARGAFIGLSMEHNRGDLLRSAVEGIAMNLEIILKIVNHGSKKMQVRLIGGLAQSKVICQILADVFETTLARMTHLEEATSIGAAVAAGVGCGLYRDFSVVDSFIHIADMVLPNPADAAKYREIKCLFEEAYQALSDVFDKQYKI
ncbi:xylulokinase [Ruthenibacterium lactatiformans]|uniref:xylulokinase n=1 Tax=Ruthenibacterium lactatiformans TaxID=1550024 RepID=UPI0039A3D336